MNRVKMRMAVWGGVCVAVLLACHPEKSRLEEALEAAGGNRSELEQVLEHYRGDSLKSAVRLARPYFCPRLLGGSRRGFLS